LLVSKRIPESKKVILMPSAHALYFGVGHVALKFFNLLVHFATNQGTRPYRPTADNSTGSHYRFYRANYA
jgi:hypothetical protein